VIVEQLRLPTFVVWIPILDADEGVAVPTASANVQISPQYFDGAQRIGDQLARTFGASEPVWDAFYFFPPGATWTPEGLPVPAIAIAQEGGVVIGTPGTLPPLPDQSRIAPELRGKALVIGEQADFEAILMQVAESFTERARTPR
jgi:hypothetical protein